MTPPTGGIQVKRHRLFIAVSFCMEVKMKTYMPILLGFAYYTVYFIKCPRNYHLCTTHINLSIKVHFIFFSHSSHSPIIIRLVHNSVLSSPDYIAVIRHSTSTYNMATSSICVYVLYLFHFTLPPS